VGATGREEELSVRLVLPRLQGFSFRVGTGKFHRVETETRIESTPGGFSLWIKRPKREADFLPPSNPESLPHLSINLSSCNRLLLKQRNGLPLTPAAPVIGTCLTDCDIFLILQIR
jgi:hypothetical protein